jgi:hypothetical protein
VSRLCLAVIALLAACGSPGGGDDDGTGPDGPVGGDSGGSGDGDGGGDGGGPRGPVVDGPPGSRVPGFDSANPSPLIILAHRVQPDAWVVALVDIATDGTLSGIVNYDRIRAFQPAGTTLLVDAAYPGARLSSWNPSSPVPLVMLARRSGQSVWTTAIAQILDDGTVTGITNVDRVRVWRVNASAPFHDGPLPASVPAWNPSAPAPLLLGASRTQMPGWILGIAAIYPDAHIGDIVVDRLVGWLPP